VGVEIHRALFSSEDYERFNARLVEELAFVKHLLNEPHNFSESKRIGYELEACLLDPHNNPAPLNFKILEDIDSDAFGNELAKYDLEINGSVFELTAQTPQNLSDDLRHKWQLLSQSAAKFNTQIGLFGVLPNLRPEHFDRHHYQSSMRRYTLFSKRIFELRQESLQLLFHGEDEIMLERNDVMSEALCTSLQIHFQIPYSQSIEYYHAALIASIVMVGIGANSPLVLGKRAWHESRIPIFEQSVDSRNALRRHQGDPKRVHLAQDYIDNWGAFFEQNAQFRTIFPDIVDEPIETLYHFNLHNGTIWRWVRPIIAQDKAGKWTIRLELRVLPAGPTLADTEANLWFFIGLIEGLVASKVDLQALAFQKLKDDFYGVAKHGMSYLFHDPVTQEKIGVDRWIETKGIDLAREGLQRLGVENIATQLALIEERLTQNGAQWQLKHFEKYHNIDKLMEDYMHYFQNDIPIARWSL